MNIHAKPPNARERILHSLHKQKHKHNAGTSEAHVASVHQRTPGCGEECMLELKFRALKVCDNFVVPGVPIFGGVFA